MAEGLYPAILAVMAEVGYVQKTGQVRGGGMNYKFAGEAAMLAALRPHMIANGLVMLPVGVSLSEHHETSPRFYQGKEQGVKTSRTVRTVSTYRLAHRSGEFVDLQVAGEGQDSGDKATAKAMTIALKYAIRQAFLIETGDDPDETRPELEPERAPLVPDKPHPALAMAKAKIKAEFGPEVGKAGSDQRKDAEEFCQATCDRSMASALSDLDCCKTILAALASR